MPRIRTIKPEFCTSEQVGECSPTARLLFATMWCFCDDAGRHTRSPLRLKAECLPFDPFTRDDMEGFINELVEAGLLIEYEFEGEQYLQVTGWKHQKIDKKSFKYPPFIDGDAKKGAAEIRRPFADGSARGSREVVERSPAEGKGEEGKGEESIELLRNSSEHQKCSTTDDDSGKAKPENKNGDAACGIVFAMQAGCYHLKTSELASYAATYAFDVRAELLKASLWLRDNKSRRPRSVRGVRSFLTSWLNRTDDRKPESSKRSGKIPCDDKLKRELARANQIRQQKRERAPA